MKIEIYEKATEQNERFRISAITNNILHKQKENIDSNSGLGSPLPKHRRQQEIQEDCLGSRGNWLVYIKT